ncbi:MAG TPA: sortase [Candidatus Saccharimonadales bacterium]
MQPNDTDQQPDMLNRGGITPPSRDNLQQHAAVAQMTREQINRIYEQQAVQEQHTETVATSSPAASPKEQNPYYQSHQAHRSVDSKQWEHYHSSWQNYYQKYYEQYYVSAVHSANQALQQHAEQLQNTQRDLATQQIAGEGSDSISKNEAMNDLRTELLTKVQESAKKVRRSRHFIPAISALCVLLVFAFFQYNSVIFSYAQAYVSPGNIDPQNIITDPNASLSVGKESRLIFPRFNIDVPVIYNNTMGATAKETDDKQMAAMRKGVAYFGARGFSAHPGEFGNFGIAGHSSNDVTDSGAAKFVFAPLLKAKKGDIFYLNYDGTRYTYSITTIKEVTPSGVSALNVGTSKPMATLITCTPLGTANNRLLVFGEQISPDPSAAKKTDTSSSSPDVSASELTGKAPTIFERLFGVN